MCHICKPSHRFCLCTFSCEYSGHTYHVMKIVFTHFHTNITLISFVTRVNSVVTSKWLEQLCTLYHKYIICGASLQCGFSCGLFTTPVIDWIHAHTILLCFLMHFDSVIRGQSISHSSSCTSLLWSNLIFKTPPFLHEERLCHALFHGCGHWPSASYSHITLISTQFKLTRQWRTDNHDNKKKYTWKYSCWEAQKFRFGQQRTLETNCHSN